MSFLLLRNIQLLILFCIDTQSPVCGDVFLPHLWQTAGDVAGYNSAAPGASVWGWLRTKHS